MEGKPKGNDFNASLETKNSNEVRFCVILEGRKGKVRFLLGQGWHDQGASPPGDLYPPPLISCNTPGSRPQPHPSWSSLAQRLLQEKQTQEEDTLPLSIWSASHTTWPSKTVWTCAVSHTAATGYISCLHLNTFK